MSTDYAERLPADCIMSEHENEVCEPLPDVEPQLGPDDRAASFGAQARSRVFGIMAAQFFVRHPMALGARLGCGPGQGFQWLDSGVENGLDVDRLDVIGLRDRLGFEPDKGHRDAPAELAQPGWWAGFALPAGPDAPPVVLICDGLLMQLTPTAVTRFLNEFERHAPAGSQLLFDAMFWLAIGDAPRSAGLWHTGLRLHWGSRRRRELATAHPGLELLSEHSVMDSCGWPHSLIGPVFRRCFGLPFYAITQLGIKVARRQ